MRPPFWRTAFVKGLLSCLIVVGLAACGGGGDGRVVVSDGDYKTASHNVVQATRALFNVSGFASAPLGGSGSRAPGRPVAVTDPGSGPGANLLRALRDRGAPVPKALECDPFEAEGFTGQVCIDEEAGVVTLTLDGAYTGEDGIDYTASLDLRLTARTQTTARMTFGYELHGSDGTSVNGSYTFDVTADAGFTTFTCHGTGTASFGDGHGYTMTARTTMDFVVTDDGVVSAEFAFTFEDTKGYHGSITLDMTAGTGSGVVKDSSNNTVATLTFHWDGTVTVHYEDGTSETI